MGERVHELKCWPEPFQAIVDGRKRFEIRKDDRGFMVGDVLHLREWDPARHESRVGVPSAKKNYAYTKRSIRARVTYIAPGGRWGLPPDVCVMGIEPVEAGAGTR